MTLDKLELCTESVERRRVVERSISVVDTASAIGGAFNEDGVEKYLKALRET